MKFYSYKNINTYTMYMTQKETNKQRAYLRIATENGKKAKCSETKFEIAKKLYHAIKTMNQYREKELYFDSVSIDYDTKQQRKFYEELQDKLFKKIKPLLRGLNIKAYCGTWWHLCTKENQDIYF